MLYVLAHRSNSFPHELITDFYFSFPLLYWAKHVPFEDEAALTQPTWLATNLMHVARIRRLGSHASMSLTSASRAWSGFMVEMVAPRASTRKCNVDYVSERGRG